MDGDGASPSLFSLHGNGARKEGNGEFRHSRIGGCSDSKPLRLFLLVADAAFGGAAEAGDLLRLQRSRFAAA